MKFRIVPSKKEESKTVTPQGFTEEQQQRQEALNDRLKLNRFLNEDGSLR